MSIMRSVIAFERMYQIKFAVTKDRALGVLAWAIYHSCMKLRYPTYSTHKSLPVL